MSKNSKYNLTIDLLLSFGTFLDALDWQSYKQATFKYKEMDKLVINSASARIHRPSDLHQSDDNNSMSSSAPRATSNDQQNTSSPSFVNLKSENSFMTNKEVSLKYLSVGLLFWCHLYLTVLEIICKGHNNLMLSGKTKTGIIHV